MMCFGGDGRKRVLNVFNAAAKKKAAMAVEVEESVGGRGRWMELILYEDDEFDEEDIRRCQFGFNWLGSSEVTERLIPA